MKLRIEKALKQGVAAHKAGQLHEAEHFYRAILQSEPRHPEANHNLGMVAVSVNKCHEALPLLKRALESNPNKEQFWVSYISVLIKEKHLEKAKQVFEQAKKHGVDGQKLNSIKKKILLKTQHLNKEITNPPQEILTKLMGVYKSGRYDDTERLATSITQQFPNHPFAWKTLGVIFKQVGKIKESLSINKKVIRLAPVDAQAHYNLGNTYKELGKSDEALASYAQAITLKPDFAEAHYNLGITFEELRRVDEAVASYAQAITLKPDFAEAYYNLGIAITNIRFNKSNRRLYPILLRLLTTGNFVSPGAVVGFILNLLKHDPLINKFLLEKNFANSLTDLTTIIASLNKLPLLHHLMRICMLPDLQFERLFVILRRYIIMNLDTVDESPELIYFLSTLSLHCFVNEYVYYESAKETHLIENLISQITKTVMQGEQPEIINILCLASYRPLHKYDWCHKLKALDFLEDVKKKLIKEPFAEKTLAKKIPVLGKISDSVSFKVKKQYEENPYPRWDKMRIFLKTKSISEICTEMNLHLYSDAIKNVIAPAILIAGCGTGQHPIQAVSRFSNCHVTAVDLSIGSLAYAQRKSEELGFTNLEFLQADILHLHQIGRKFDIIESSGVLHHMDEPMAGWRVLVNLLNPGGLMRIGLYSELARQPIVSVREEIELLKVGTSEAEMRKFRQKLIDSDNENHKTITKSQDFFSLSMLRDLIFHVKEHRFTLPQIKNCLNELGLKFCGFEKNDIKNQFKKVHTKEEDIEDLLLWHQFEKANPRTFVGMYLFWCQKI